MSILDDNLINNVDNTVVSLDNMVESFIHELFKTDKKIINNYGLNPDDNCYILTRKHWRMYNYLYIYKANEICDRMYDTTFEICEAIIYKGEALTFKMIKEYYGVA